MEDQAIIDLQTAVQIAVTNATFTPVAIPDLTVTPSPVTLG